MIIDDFKNFSQYFKLNSNLKAVYNYLNSLDINSLEKGEYTINENAYVIIAYDEPKNDFTPKLEVHRKYIDLQFAISGEFQIGWKFLDNCKNRLIQFDTEKDFELFSDDSQVVVNLEASTFCLLFPNDAHVPFPPKNGKLVKGIVKIKVD